MPSSNSSIGDYLICGLIASGQSNSPKHSYCLISNISFEWLTLIVWSWIKAIFSIYKIKAKLRTVIKHAYGNSSNDSTS